MIMHQITLCTLCTVLFNCCHLLHIRVDHAEPKSRFQVVQVQWVFGGPEALSSDDANIIMIKASLGASTHRP
jgi:hypothetical protein